MNYILSVLKNWGIEVPEEGHYTEYLQTRNPEKFFYIDQCPFVVGEKHSQIEIIFDDAVNDKKLMENYLKLESKYSNILTKLWLYNDVFIETDILNSKAIIDKRIEDEQLNEKIQTLIRKINKSDFFEIIKKDELNLLLQAAVRTYVYTVFHFKEYELLIVPSWSCLIAYFNDTSKISIVEKIVNVEGLYLRPLIENLK